MLLKEMFGRIAKISGLAVTGLMAATAAKAQDVIGVPLPDQIGMQPAATSIAEDVHHFHNWILMPIITVITLFVMLLLFWVMFRYNAKRNPVPSKTTHNTLIEILWTVIPILILIAISIPSFKLLYKQLDLPKTDGATPTDAPLFVAVAVDAGGQLFWGDEPVTPQQLQTKVRDSARRNPATEVQLRADQAVPFGRIAELIGLVQAGGLNRVGFVTETAAAPSAK